MVYSVTCWDVAYVTVEPRVSERAALSSSQESLLLNEDSLSTCSVDMDVSSEKVIIRLWGTEQSFQVCGRFRFTSGVQVDFSRSLHIQQNSWKIELVFRVHNSGGVLPATRSLHYA